MTTENLFGYHRQRSKGRKGERDVCAMLEAHGIVHDWQGYEDQRYESAGADILTAGMAIEVKRRADGPFLADWWRQAVDAGRKWNRQPAVVYRFDRQKWRMRLMLAGLLADVSFEDWCKLNKQQEAA